MKKAEAILRWVQGAPNQDILPHFTALPANSAGSTFGACQIRISGNPLFIDAVLSRLKDLLDADNGSTRLDFGRSPVKPVFDKEWKNADTDAEVCYIKLKERTALTRQKAYAKNSQELLSLDTPENTPESAPTSDSAPEPAKATPKRRKTSPTPAPAPKNKEEPKPAPSTSAPPPPPVGGTGLFVCGLDEEL